MSEEPKQTKGRDLVNRKLVEAPPPAPHLSSKFSAGHPKAALLFYVLEDVLFSFFPGSFYSCIYCVYSCIVLYHCGHLSFILSFSVLAVPRRPLCFVSTKLLFFHFSLVRFIVVSIVSICLSGHLSFILSFSVLVVSRRHFCLVSSLLIYFYYFSWLVLLLCLLCLFVFYHCGHLPGGGRVARWCWVNFQCRGVAQFGLQ